MKKTIYFFFLICYSFISIGQFGYYEDALRYGRTYYDMGSTARMKGIGGTQISLGGDISSAISNPAGLGFFNRSVFVVSPSLNFSTANTDFFVSSDGGVRNSQETFKNNFSFANMGTVINFNKGRFTESEFKGSSLAISFSRIKSHHLNRSYKGENNFNSIADALAITAGKTFEENLISYEEAAWEQYLISPIFDSDGSIVRYEADFDGFPIQSETIKESGSQYQINIAWGGNYKDILYFGGRVGTQLINYEQERAYRESEFAVFDGNGNFTGEDTRLNDFSIYDSLEVTGTGINFNFGLIVKPVSFLNIGVSYTSSSFLSLNEESFFDFDANWKAGATFADSVDISNIEPFIGSRIISDYTIRTPSRLALGTSIFIAKNGFLTGDIEFINYANAVINSDDFSPPYSNLTIADIYESVINIRVGGEYRFDKFMIRAGYAILPSPYKNSNLDEQTNITFGVGYRTLNYFFDFSVVNNKRTINYVPYEISDFQPIASSKITNTTFSVTFGRFLGSK